jgi:protein-disulfide isomerase
MKINRLVVLLGMLLISAQLVALENRKNAFSKVQKNEIQSIIHDYLVTNPEILIEASKALQEKQQKEMLAKVQAEIPKYKNTIFRSKTSPIVGNPKGQVYVVEFIDYACGHCRRMFKVINKVLESDKSVKVILKEFPIFGGPSDYAARMALAASKHGKYKKFHQELFEVAPPLDEKKIDNIAKKLKLDLTKMKEIAQSEEVTNEMRETLELARNIGIMGTPAFIVANNIDTDNFKSFFVPGSLTFEELNELLTKVKK